MNLSAWSSELLLKKRLKRLKRTHRTCLLYGSRVRMAAVEELPCAQRHLGCGRVLALEMEATNTLANLVWSEWAIAQCDNTTEPERHRAGRRPQARELARVAAVHTAARATRARAVPVGVLRRRQSHVRECIRGVDEVVAVVLLHHRQEGLREPRRGTATFLARRGLRLGGPAGDGGAELGLRVGQYPTVSPVRGRLKIERRYR